MVRRAEVHPAVGRVHARHVHAMAGRAGALDRVAEPDRIDVHRVADPERPEEEHVVAALDGFAERVARALGSVSAFGQLGPLLFHREHESRRVVAEHAVAACAIACGPSPEGRPGSFKRTGTVRVGLRRIELQLERRESAPAAVATAARATSRCPCAADCACVFSVDSRASAIMFMLTGPARVGIDGREHAGLADEGRDSEARRGHVPQVRRGPRPPVDRHLVPLARDAVDGMRVAARRIADDLEREVGRDRAAAASTGGQRSGNSKQARARAAANATPDRRAADAGSSRRRSRRRSGPSLSSRVQR